MLGVAAFDRQAEQVAEQGEDQPLAVGRDGDVGSRDLASLELNGAPAVVLGRGWADEEN
ncbi:MAG: hypothetical protein IIB38_16030 [Candidatus Hydrogenedentes bacterium]|nr:hypothetical protein [Candidatus Hydrogenedentota bacterium]